jgi:choline dehydrogenase-like flavoprotein
MPDNRVTLDGDGNVQLAYTSTNDDEAKHLYEELKKILNHCGMASHHVLRKNFYMSSLYVVDTSFFPSIGAVNPALTAMANAIRVGEHLTGRLA